MFYLFSKILYFIIQPINWILLCLLIAFFSKKEKRKKRSLTIGLILFLFFTNHFIFNQVMRLWEVDTITTNQIEGDYDIGILLGGYTNIHIEPYVDRHNFSERANRFNNTLELYHKGKIKKILLTGGSTAIIEKVMVNEAISVHQFLLTIGIPEEDIIIESAARNTYENALFTKKILSEKYPNAKCLLITSAWHMRRARACYKKQNIQFTPFSVDYIGERTRWMPESLFIPDRMGFYRWEILIKEWFGCLAYKLKGYI